MATNRNYVIDRLKSRIVSSEEFNYDRLQAPPLCYFMSPYDIAELNSIARSITLSSKPQIRYQEIDRVMKRLGMMKFAAGTNRVVYSHPEFPDILFKIASDDVGMGDNPAEYRNQFLLKPFVAKCFEISPCGTVGIFERVNPITSREEYLSVADDIFELINTWLIGEYVLADIGSRFFANTGIRKNFGIVLLDYPYVYKLDGSKLYCNKPDINSISGKCDGIIDYDDGYNFLKCTKCGATYKAKELEEKIKNNEIINDKGVKKMKITIKGGSKNIEKTTVNTGSISDNSHFSPAKAAMGCAPAPKLPEVVAEPKNEEHVVKEEPKMEVNGVNNEVKVEPVKKSPITISDDVKKEAVANKKEEVSPVKSIEDSMISIENMVNKIDIDSVKEDVLSRTFASIISLIETELSPVTAFKMLLEKANNIFGESEEQNFIDMLNDKNLIDIISAGGFEPVTTNLDVELVDDRIDIIMNNSIYMFETVDSDEVDKEVPSSSRKITKSISWDKCTDNRSCEEKSDPVKEEVEEVVEKKSDDNSYNGIELYSAEIINIKNIVPDQNNYDVIVMLDDHNNYIKNEDNNIIAISSINDTTVNSSKIVSKKWFDDAVEIINNRISNNDDAESEVKDIPVGVLAPEEEVSPAE